MAFLLRNISYSADGRRIVRTSRIEKDRLTIGRDAGSDIRLNDLIVALRHATLRQVSPARIAVSPEAGLAIVDGADSRSGRIELATGGTVRIGPYELRILPQPPEEQDVSVEVERVGSEEADERFDKRRFALASVMPGKRRLAWALVVLVLGLFLAWPIWSFYARERSRAEYAEGFNGDRLWLSGSLSQGHAALADDCRACHVQPFVAVRDESCTACHTGIHDHADVGRLRRAQPGLGAWDRFQLSVQETFGLDPGRCVDCHTEHEGPQQIPATPQRFCSDCHADLDAQLADTRLGDAADFEEVHPEFQPTLLIRWDAEQPLMRRVSLAQRPREASNLKFPHALHLDASGGVAQMARRLSATYGFGARLECADCHVPTPDGVRFQPPDMEGDCGMCHSLAFEQIDGTVRTLRHGEPRQVVADIRSFYRAGLRQRPPGLAAPRSRPGDINQARLAAQRSRAGAATGTRADQAVRAVFSPPDGACFECHQVVAPAGGSLAYGIRPVAFPTRYMLHGWFDHRAHRLVQRPGEPRLEGSPACLSCHRADASADASDLLLPGVASCRACHGGETSGLPVESRCAMCHDYHMDEGVPAMLLRQQVRGRRWTTTVIPVQPQQPPQARGR